MTIDLMSEINCHVEILPRPRIESATSLDHRFYDRSIELGTGYYIYQKSSYRYLEIQTEVQNNMASVSSRNKEVVSEQERIKVEMEREKQLAKAAKLAQEELDIEKQKYEEELKILTSDRDKFMKQAGIFEIYMTICTF